MSVKHTTSSLHRPHNGTLWSEYSLLLQLYVGVSDYILDATYNFFIERFFMQAYVF